jgi:hypothetical protein
MIVVWVDHKVEDCLGLGKEKVGQDHPDRCLEILVMSGFDRASSCPN